MIHFSKTPIIMALAGMALSGCVNTGYPISTVDGAATANNFNSQVIDPTPVEGAPVMEAQMADAAVDRYHNDELKKPGDTAEGSVSGLKLSSGSGGN